MFQHFSLEVLPPSPSFLIYSLIARKTYHSNPIVSTSHVCVRERERERERERVLLALKNRYLITLLIWAGKPHDTILVIIQRTKQL
jgi:hypothetical protein